MAGRRSGMRALPALGTAMLFALVGATSSRNAAGPAPGSLMPPLPALPCDDYTLVTGGDQHYLFASENSILQPLPEGSVVPACSLSVQANAWSYAQMDVMDWDPVALAPDRTTLTLRSAYLDPSAFNYYTENRTHRVLLTPPVISRSMDGVADPPRSTLAIKLRCVNGTFDATYDPAGTSALPAARRMVDVFTWPTLPGAHPVFAQGLCLGDANQEQLRIGQSVSRTDQHLNDTTFMTVQRFRVPAPFALHRVELAVAPHAPWNYYYWIAGSVSIRDAEGIATPATSLPPPLVEAFYPAGQNVQNPTWITDEGFDHTITLVPNHDYFLVTDATSSEYPPLHNVPGLDLYTRAVTGTESPAFQYGIGELWRRPMASSAWKLVAGRALSFKLVGVPLTPLAVPPAGAKATFRLAVAPNPARGPLRVEWSGAVGPVRLEVFDARGRRVGRGDGGAAGTWQWSSLGTRGEPLPSGVYLVHARDSAGEQSVQRLVLYR